MGILDGCGVGKWGADRWTQEMQQKQFDRDAIIAAVAGEMRKTVEAHRQQENRNDAIRAGIQPAPLDAPDAGVNPDATIRGTT